LRAYESIRYARATATQASSRLNQYIFHLPDGPEQEERDRQMKTAMEVALSEVGEDVRRRVQSTATVGGASADVMGRAQGNGAPADPNRDNANQWADKVKSRVQFGYDADVEAEKWWAEHGHRTIGVLARL
jgi:salicylate hydroxylase